ncbi:hypothetical protein, partial [Raoultella terrigena]|uniref:hypothetical protein n=1 Tax=Raoultella terrigena TaxID=577 RepID=UPI001C70A72C
AGYLQDGVLSGHARVWYGQIDRTPAYAEPAALNPEDRTCAGAGVGEKYQRQAFRSEVALRRGAIHDDGA